MVGRQRKKIGQHERKCPVALLLLASRSLKRRRRNHHGGSKLDFPKSLGEILRVSE